MRKSKDMSKRLYIAVIFGVAVIIFGFAAVRNDVRPVSNPSDKISVVASFYPLYFFASEIGGDKVAVTNVTPAGAEPHDYEPTAKDMYAIENSKMLVLNGAKFEAWGERIAKNINPEQTTVVFAGENLSTEDPHAWLSPILAQKMVERITSALVSVDPINAPYYEFNTEALKEKLMALDDEYSKGLGSCAQKNIITSHAAFGQMASAYGFSQVSIAGLSPDAEPSPKELANIAKFAKDNDIKYIFFENLVSPKLSETIATEIGAQTLVLNPLEGLSDDEIRRGNDYMTEMRDNLYNLEIALECKK